MRADVLGKVVVSMGKLTEFLTVNSNLQLPEGGAMMAERRIPPLVFVVDDAAVCDAISRRSVVEGRELTWQTLSSE